MLPVEDGWRAAGFDVGECWRRACSVTDEYEYIPNTPARIKQKRVEQAMIPLKHRTLQETLNPQPDAGYFFLSGRGILFQGCGQNKK